DELPEEDRDVTGFDGNEAARALWIPDFPSAFADEPIDEGRDGVRQPVLDRCLRDIAHSIWMRDRERNDTRLIEVWNASVQRHIGRLSRGLIDLDFGCECGIHRVLNRSNGTEAVAQVDGIDALRVEIRAEILIE